MLTLSDSLQRARATHARERTHTGLQADKHAGHGMQVALVLKLWPAGHATHRNSTNNKAFEHLHPSFHKAAAAAFDKTRQTGSRAFLRSVTQRKHVLVLFL